MRFCPIKQNSSSQLRRGLERSEPQQGENFEAVGSHSSTPTQGGVIISTSELLTARRFPGGKFRRADFATLEDAVALPDKLPFPREFAAQCLPLQSDS